MNKSDERYWCDARLVDLAYLIEEKQRDLESAFSVWPAAFAHEPGLTGVTYLVTPQA